MTSKNQWKDMSTAPIGVPVKAVCSFNPNDSDLSFHERFVINKHGTPDNWRTYDKNSLLIFPIKWKEVDDL